MRLIDADRLCAELCNIGVKFAREGKTREDNAVLKCIDATCSQPTLDMFVRCKDCIRRETVECPMIGDCESCGKVVDLSMGDDFCCPYGERVDPADELMSNPRTLENQKG